MAAYAALVSIMQSIHEIEQHPFPPISMDKKQVESLTEIVAFLQEFLEGYKSPFADGDEADPLEMRIADTVYAAKDAIESHIVDQIVKVVSAEFCTSLLEVMDGRYLSILCKVKQRGAVKDHLQKQVLESVDSSTCAELYESLVKEIENMDLIKKEVMEIVAVKDPLQRQVSASTSVADSSTSNNILASSPSRPKSTIMVGFEDVTLQLMEKLIYGQHGRQVIPIVGMGGIGKTTLATNVYEKTVKSCHFDICAWVTISQEYNTKELFCEILSQANKERKERLSQMREDEIGLSLHKCLSYRRYLIVLDDMWSIEAWEKLQCYFPDNSNGSRIMVTTRLSNLGSQLESSYGLEMKFMDEVSSWNMFCKIVFGGRSCPLGLEKIGKKIVKSCRGLPLSIVVLGGILEKLEGTNECWKSVRRSLNSLVNSENDKQCLNILRLSYKHLPVYLKPCFLYMGMFKEDSEIQVSKVIKLWVSEGFLKPVSGKSLETIAKEYLSELVDRNLILVHKFGKTGNMKYLKMHDLLRDFCLREAEKERFYHVVRQHSTQGTYVEKRVFVSRCTSMEKVLHAMRWTLRAYDALLPNMGQNGSNHYCEEIDELLRNLCLREAEKETFNDVVGQHFPQGTCSQRHVFTIGSTSKEKYFDAMEWTSSRLCKMKFYQKERNTFALDNLRLLVVYSRGQYIQLPSYVNLFWSLQTLIVHSLYTNNVRVPVEIWNMPQLRHVHFENGCIWSRYVRGALCLQNPPNDSIVVMENLQTLKGVKNFNCDEMMVLRVPNIKKLGLIYDGFGAIESLDNIGRLQKLESLSCKLTKFLPEEGIFYLRQLTFPHSLKKLTLEIHGGTMEEIFGKVSTLPLLQRLKLSHGRFGTHKWETVEGQFQSLKILSLNLCSGLECWKMESSHFPSLEHLHLRSIDLNEIPAELGEIPTLKSVALDYCSASAVKSARRMVEEQEELQGEEQLSFKVSVMLLVPNKELESLANPNFQVTVLRN